MLGAIQADDSWEVLRARIESSAHDVATFIERRAGCNHFRGEVGSDYPERERQVQDALKELRCDDIEADERVLRKKHSTRPEVPELLSNTRDLMPW